jgi:hypothetical protein
VTSKGLNARTAKFTVKLTKGQFAALLKDYGLKSETVKNKALTVPVFVLFGEHLYSNQQRQLYTAKAGGTGASKTMLVK